MAASNWTFKINYRPHDEPPIWVLANPYPCIEDAAEAAGKFLLSEAESGIHPMVALAELPQT